MNEKFLVEEYKFHKPLLSQIDSIFDNCKRECCYKYYHTHKMILDYNINFINK